MILCSKKLVFILVAVLTFYSCSQDESLIEVQNNDKVSLTDQKALQPSVFLNVPYGSDVKQIYDIYLPAGRTANRTKVIILIHGGSWSGGSKAMMRHLVSAIQLSNPDHAIVNMNYVTAQYGVSYAFPNQFLDIQALINTLKNHRLDYNILPEFGLVGGSAGGQLALMYDSVYDLTDDVKFVCSIAGPTNFNDPVYTSRPDFSQLLDLLVDPSVYPNIENNLELLSPVSQVSQFSSPTVMFYGDRDRKVPLATAFQLKKELKSQGINHDLTVLNGGHFDWGDIGYTKIYDGIEDFINEHLSL